MTESDITILEIHLPKTDKTVSDIMKSDKMESDKLESDKMSVPVRPVKGLRR